MPARSDHIRRDAQHAARAEIAIAMSKYIRRLSEEAYAHIDSELAAHGGGEIDGTQLGRDAAKAAFAGYLGIEDVHETVDALPAAGE